LGFPEPQSIIDILGIYNEVEAAYSIGELIEFLQSVAENNEVRISTRTNLVSFDVITEEGRYGYSFNEDELIDSLYEAYITLKEEKI
jgi:hypothetical protein